MKDYEYVKLESALNDLTHITDALNNAVNKILLLDQAINFMSMKERADLLRNEARLKVTISQIDCKSYRVIR